MQHPGLRIGPLFGIYDTPSLIHYKIGYAQVQEQGAHEQSTKDDHNTMDDRSTPRCKKYPPT